MAKSKKIIKKRVQKINAPKKCYFCEEKKDPDFADTVSLQKFMTERGKIIPRSRSGICSKHQKKLTSEIKRARILALLPFVNRI